MVYPVAPATHGSIPWEGLAYAKGSIPVPASKKDIMKRLKTILIEILIFSLIGLSPLWAVALNYWLQRGW